MRNYDKATARRIRTLGNNYKRIYLTAVKQGQTKIKRMALNAIRTLERLDPTKHPRRLEGFVTQTVVSNLTTKFIFWEMLKLTSRSLNNSTNSIKT